MFTGIVEKAGRLRSRQANQMTFTYDGYLKGLDIGGSIAVNGTCLTITSLDTGTFTVEVMPETLNRTNLGLVKTGGMVNLETPLDMGKPLGGHFVQGHVDGTGKVSSIQSLGDATLITIAAPPDIMRYIVDKGFIAVDGISLTVVKKDRGSFSVSIVRHTFENTTLGIRSAGDMVNLEADILGKYVENFSTPEKGGIDEDFLSQHGFL